MGVSYDGSMIIRDSHLPYGSLSSANSIHFRSMCLLQLQPLPLHLYIQASRMRKVAKGHPSLPSGTRLDVTDTLGLLTSH